MRKGDRKVILQSLMIPFVHSWSIPQASQMPAPPPLEVRLEMTPTLNSSSMEITTMKMKRMKQRMRMKKRKKRKWYLCFSLDFIFLLLF